MEENNNLVIIELDRPRELRFGHKALKMIKVLTGKAITEIDITSFPAEDIEKIMYTGLLRDDKSLTLEQMEDLLDKAPTYASILDALTQALNVAFTGSKEIKNEVEAVEEDQVEETEEEPGTGDDPLTLLSE